MSDIKPNPNSTPTSNSNSGPNTSQCKITCRCGTRDVSRTEKRNLKNDLMQHIDHGINRGTYVNESKRSASDLSSGRVAKSNQNQNVKLSNLRVTSTKLITIPVVFYVKCPTGPTGITDADLNDFIKSLNDNYAGNVQVPVPSSVNAGEHQKEYDQYLSLKSSVPVVFKMARKPVYVRKQLVVAENMDTTPMSRYDEIIKGNPFGKGIARTPYDIPVTDLRKTLNIWLVTFTNGLLGYAQFPWDLASKPYTDGVVLDYRTISPKFNYAPYNMNRTAVHEVGHWLGLYHTFNSDPIGDGGVLDTNNSSKTGKADDVMEKTGDCISDTPPQLNASYGNPFKEDPKTWPTEEIEGKKQLCMFMNYMDYSDDCALFMFTKEQATKISLLINTYRHEML